MVKKRLLIKRHPRGKGHANIAFYFTLRSRSSDGSNIFHYQQGARRLEGRMSKFNCHDSIPKLTGQSRAPSTTSLPSQNMRKPEFNQYRNQLIGNAVEGRGINHVMIHEHHGAVGLNGKPRMRKTNNDGAAFLHWLVRRQIRGLQ